MWSIIDMRERDRERGADGWKGHVDLLTSGILATVPVHGAETEAASDARTGPCPAGGTGASNTQGISWH